MDGAKIGPRRLHGPGPMGQGRWADRPGPMGLKNLPVGAYSGARGRWAPKGVYSRARGRWGPKGSMGLGDPRGGFIL